MNRRILVFSLAALAITACDKKKASEAVNNSLHDKGACPQISEGRYVLTSDSEAKLQDKDGNLAAPKYIDVKDDKQAQQLEFTFQSHEDVAANGTSQDQKSKARISGSCLSTSKGTVSFSGSNKLNHQTNFTISKRENNDPGLHLVAREPQEFEADYQPAGAIGSAIAGFENLSTNPNASGLPGAVTIKDNPNVKDDLGVQINGAINKGVQDTKNTAINAFDASKKSGDDMANKVDGQVKRITGSQPSPDQQQNNVAAPAAPQQAK